MACCWPVVGVPFWVGCRVGAVVLEEESLVGFGWGCGVVVGVPVPVGGEGVSDLFQLPHGSSCGLGGGECVGGDWVGV